MFPSRLVSARIQRLSALAAVCLFCISGLGARKTPITLLKLDPDAPVVDVFAGMESGQIDVRMVVANPNEGRIYFTNKTDRPLTVAIPKALVGVHVLPQANGFFNNLIGNQNGGMMMNGGLLGGNMGMGGGGMAQGVGGNAMPGGQNGFPNGGLNNQFPGNNVFSIPPEKIVQLNLHTVCLNYGRPEPDTGLHYRLVKVESVTTDPVLQQLLADYSPNTNQEAQQAAAWHLANGLSWEQISNLTTEPSPGIHVPLFNQVQLQSALQLVDKAKTRAAERTDKTAAPIQTAAIRK